MNNDITISPAAAAIITSSEPSVFRIKQALNHAKLPSPFPKKHTRDTPMWSFREIERAGVMLGINLKRGYDFLRNSRVR